IVSKAREDLPDPLRPVITVRVLRGISTSMFLRLCWRAPRTEILVIGMQSERAMTFRNVDGFPRNGGKWGCAALLRILFVNRNHRQRGYSEKQARNTEINRRAGRTKGLGAGI